MPHSEIDEIFAAKRNSTPPSVLDKKKPKCQKKKQPSKIQQTDIAEKISKKRPVPETIVDPSAQLVPPKRAKTTSKSKLETRMSDGSKAEDDRFQNSRGTGTRRKTTDGLYIYKEDELGISTGGGDTPLCPFDCDCCF